MLLWIDLHVGHHLMALLDPLYDRFAPATWLTKWLYWHVCSEAGS